MKKSIALTVALGMTLALAGCSSSTSGTSNKEGSSDNTGKLSGTVTVAANGGMVQSAIEKKIAPAFEKKYGVKVKFVSALSAEILAKIELEKNNPSYDVAFYVPTDVQRASDKGLSVKLDPSAIPNAAKVDSRFVAVDGMGVPVFGYTIAPAYNTDYFSQKGLPAITSWADLANPQFKGITGVTDIINDWGFNMLYGMTLASGGDVSNVQPGIETAKKLASNTKTFYKNSTVLMPSVQQGAVNLTVLSSYSTADLAANKNVPIKIVIPKEGAPLQAFNATLVKNSANEKAAQAFIDFAVSTEAQQAVADAGFYPVVQGMKIADKYQSIVGLKDSDKMFRPDVKKLGEVRNDWTDKWNATVTPALGSNLK